MKLQLNSTPEQIELVRAIGSKDVATSREALEALAAFISPVISTVLNQLGTAGLVYRDLQYDEDDSPSIPLDLYYDVDVGHISTWSQSWGGGLPTNQIEGIKEMKISTYRLDTAVSWLKKYARKSRLDVISKAIERMAQEILIKQERNAWAVICRALAEASTNSLAHTISSATAGVFQIQDLNSLMVRIKRINQSFAQGTPAGFDSKGLTDLFVSPEIKGQIRTFAYNPMNDRGSQSTGPVPLPEATRQRIFDNAGASELYGVSITELNELGETQKYNVLFGEFASGNIDHGSTFNTSTSELIIGLDLGRDAFVRPLARQAESGGTFVTLPDDQWVTRNEKAGLYGYLEEGRACIDARAVVGIIV